MIPVDISTIKLGIVSPMGNERDTAVQFVKDVLLQCEGFRAVVMFTILDKVSQDGTIPLLQELETQEPRLRVVWAPENRCVVDAYVRGYKEALKVGCDWILEIDAGYSHQPSEIPKFFNKMKEGYDCVFGSRFSQGGQYTKAPFRRYLVSCGGSVLINLFMGTRLTDMTSGFELFTSKALEHVLKRGINSRAHFFQSEIKVHCRKFNISEVPIHYSNPSDNVSSKVVEDAFTNLGRLFWKRVRGKL